MMHQYSGTSLVIELPNVSYQEFIIPEDGVHLVLGRVRCLLPGIYF